MQTTANIKPPRHSRKEAQLFIYQNQNFATCKGLQQSSHQKLNRGTNLAEEPSQETPPISEHASTRTAHESNQVRRRFSDENNRLLGCRSTRDVN
jgi:hypothetical protein